MANEDKLRDYLKLVTANLRQVRRRLTEVEERSRSRSRSSVWAAVSPAG